VAPPETGLTAPQSRIVSGIRASQASRTFAHELNKAASAACFARWNRRAPTYRRRAVNSPVAPVFADHLFKSPLKRLI
jgi:hypothetical protein